MNEIGQLSFERNIKPLFRAMDREARDGAFDGLPE